MKAISILVFFLVALAGLFFLHGVYLAIRYSYKKIPQLMPNFANTIITTSGAVLATNLGAVTGLKTAYGTKLSSF